ncbi:hypothetical protein SAMN06272771_3675 [Streptomyces sp. Ag82_O1-12]|uniref:hypothetical protein n=1 Tax=unclassified Streptomyces TaxID=2593676 RepID=UPI000BCEDD27|nr:MULTISPECIES: hypothetical protein [unclassified Streptomyces]SMQ17279.1 hypothetical protein SAMN06272771_3675 [Streptomyces sp. Ag82_O1-12]SOD46312.1 hypothetical protein SAMN06272727_3672 [Streptomyces sp. Ag82_G6-1]
MTDQLPEWMLRAFSRLRLARYVASARGNAAVAARLYWWNIEASAALYGSLHCLELALRNALHHQLSLAYGRDDWWAVAPLNPNGQRLVVKARSKCERRGLVPAPADDIVAELSFGFWASLVSGGSRYDRLFWVPTVHKAFAHYSGRRDALYDGLWSLVLLRNRIMHHEPIHHRDLAADHAKIYRMLGYLDPQIAKEAQALDRFPVVLASRGDVLSGSRPPRF